MKKLILITSVALMFFCVSRSALFAQRLSTRPGQQGVAAQYFLGGEDQVLMKVNIWGFVGQPGQYMVPYDTDLVSLLSYAGGPSESAKIKSIKIVRAKPNSDTTEGEVIAVDVKKFLTKADPSIIPVLKPGDTILVSGSTFHFISRFFDFVWRVAVIVQVWTFINYYSRR